jgi:hypothetical protein
LSLTETVHDPDPRKLGALPGELVTLPGVLLVATLCSVITSPPSLRVRVHVRSDTGGGENGTADPFRNVVVLTGDERARAGDDEASRERTNTQLSMNW